MIIKKSKNGTDNQDREEYNLGLDEINE